MGNIAAINCDNPNFNVRNEETKEDLLALSLESSRCDKITKAILYAWEVPTCFSRKDFARYEDIAEDNDNEIGALRVKNIFLSNKDFYYATEENDNTLNTTESSTPKEESYITKLIEYQLIPNANDPKSFKDIGGMFETKKTLNDFIIKPWDKKYRQKIIDNKLQRPSGILLSGPPGCGKTFIMKALAAETGYDLYEINLATIGSSAAYETQNTMKEIFETLEEKYKQTGEPSILILDELDSIARSRKNSLMMDWRKDQINTLLLEMNNSSQRGIILIGATNFPEEIDEAVKRSGRLDKHLTISYPSEKEIYSIVEKLLEGRPVTAELMNHTQEIAHTLKGLSPADISTVINNTCLNAIYDNRDSATLEDFNKMFNALKRTTETRTPIGFHQNKS